jgi:hypothetical protein
LPNWNPPRNDEPCISVLPDSPQPTAASPGQAANPPMDSIPQIPANARPDHVVEGSNIPPEILGILMQERLCRTGLENLDRDLLKYMLMALLSSRASQKIKSGPALSLVSNQLKWQQLGSELCPQLLILDGSNFPSWSAALVDTVSCVTTNPRYLDQDLLASNQPTLNGVFAVIKFSIDAFLRPSLNGMSAYGAYQSLKGRFASPSWSLLLSRWSDIARAPDTSDAISASYESLKRNLLDLEERRGGWTTDKLLSLAFHSSLKRYHQQVADVIDSRLAIVPGLPILSTNILHAATRLHLSATSVGQQSLMGILASQGRGRGNSCPPCGSNGPPGCSQMSGGWSNNFPPDAWGAKFMTLAFPCSSCWEWGHWAPDCPRVKAKLPALEDP